MFCIQGADSSILNLVIDRNSTTAIKISGNSATVTGNYIGTDTTGKLAQGNSGIGVSIVDASSATVSNNVISANSGHGVSVTGSSSTSNTISNNKIGTDVDGKLDLGNTGDGVYLRDGSNNTTSDNVISGNNGNGVNITGSSATTNVVVSNKIGTNADGDTALANDKDGVLIDGGARSNTIGSGNVISGNTLNGVHITGSDTDSNTVTGNKVGTDAVGNKAVANGKDGVQIEGGAKSNKIESGNVISGNTERGVHIYGDGTNDNVVKGNLIGTKADGAAALPNKLSGVFIRMKASSNDVQDNTISGNDRWGVRITGTDTKENTVTGNKIGADQGGNLAVPNKSGGVLIAYKATKNAIGGVGSGRNIISGNQGPGVQIGGDGGEAPTKNDVTGNYIGTKIDGMNPLANSGDGVLLTDGARENTVESNVISGNSKNGVSITGLNTDENIIKSNKIGTNQAGTAGVPNQENGVQIEGSGTRRRWNRIEDNTISANLHNGIRISGNETNANIVVDNKIGTQTNGSSGLGNTKNGVLIESSARYNQIGSGSIGSGGGNVISDNGENGVHITGTNTVENTVSENKIGTNSAGTGPLGNTQNGVLIDDGANGTEVDDNLISGNKLNGVRITGSATNDNTLTGNEIGTKTGGASSLPNSENGVSIDDGAYANKLDKNTISGNALHGVRIAGSSTKDNTLFYNHIGTDKTGSAKVENSKRGVYIEDGSHHNTLDLNTISGNAEHGVHITGFGGAAPHDNMLTGNYIGLADAGSKLANGQTGVVLDAGAHTNIIGTVGKGNKISGNTDNGLYIKESNNNTVHANNFGAFSAVGNGQHGVRITDGNDNKIGGTGAGEGNKIGYNGADGVFVSSGDRNAVRRNSIYDNGGLGIDLGDNGPTPVDVLDVDTQGGNLGQNFPLITKWTGADIEGILHSAPGTYTIEIYTNTADDPSGFGEGETYLTDATVIVDGKGNGTWKAIGFSGSNISAIAIDSAGNTSEFGTRAKVQLEHVDFKGTGNEDIRINGTTDIGNPTGGAGDLEWIRSVREATNKSAVAWTTAQSAPAAFVVGNKLSAEVRTTAGGSKLTEFKLMADNKTGAYGEIEEKSFTIASGEAKAMVSSASSLSKIAANTIELEWKVSEFTINGSPYPAEYRIDDSSHRIYSLFSNGKGAMAEPWANLLEITTNVMSGKGGTPADASDAVAEMTRGIHYSKWIPLNANIMFLDATATLVYNPSTNHTNYIGPPASPTTLAELQTHVAQQRYDVNYFLNNIGGAVDQQCSDSANLLSVSLASVGISLQPRWIVGAGSPPALLEPTAAYYRAGTAVPTTDTFNFHQFGIYDGKVYDPNTRPGAASDPNMGMTFTAYLDAVFPGQRAAGYLDVDVTSVSVGAVPLLAAGTSGSITDVLVTEADLAVMADAALARWEAAGIDVSALRDVNLHVDDLDAPYLGLAFGDTIWIDRDAAGYGWFVDPSPLEDSEFDGAGVAGMDLLTVLVHEFGHMLGFEDNTNVHDVMHQSLRTGLRRIEITSPQADTTTIGLDAHNEDLAIVHFVPNWPLAEEDGSPNEDAQVQDGTVRNSSPESVANSALDEVYRNYADWADFSSQLHRKRGNSLPKDFEELDRIFEWHSNLLVDMRFYDLTRRQR